MQQAYPCFLSSEIKKIDISMTTSEMKTRFLFYPLLCGLTIDSIVQKFVFFPEALTRKSQTIAYMGHLL